MIFENPLGWLLGLSAIPLILLYILKTKGQLVRIPSILPWLAIQRQQQARSPWQKLRNRPLFWLQLLMLLLLAAALAHPVIHSGPKGTKTIIYVLDQSASMGTLEDGKKNRLDLAKEEILKQTKPLNKGWGVSLVVAGFRTQVWNNLRPGNELEQVLNQVEPLPGPSAINESLHLVRGLVRANPGAQVHLYSDFAFAQPRDGWDLPGSSKVTSHSMGQEKQNIAIVRVSPVPALKGKGGSLDLSVARFGSENEAKLLVLVDGQQQHEITLNPKVPVQDERLAIQVKPGQEIVVRITPGDAFSLDDEVTFPWPLSPKIRLGFIGPPSRFMTEAVASLPFVLVVPGNDVDVLMGDLKGLPFEPADHPVPRMGYLLFGWQPPGHEVLEQPWVTEAAQDPALSFISWESILFAQCFTSKNPGPVRGILHTSQGQAVAWRGPLREREAILFGFSHTQTDLPITPAFPILLANTLRSLGRDALGEVIRPGGIPVPVTVPPTDSLTLNGPNTRTTVDQRRRYLEPPDNVGIYHLEDGKGQKRQSFAVALLNRDESRILPGPAPKFETSGQGKEQAGTGFSDLRWILALILLSLGILEWVLAFRGVP